MAVLLIGSAFFSGCTHEYVMKMSNGTRITSANRPQLDKNTGQYVYKDARGGKHYISQARVLEIEPASDEKDSKPIKK